MATSNPPCTTSCIALFFLFIFSSSLTHTDAYERLGPNGNITIKWDVISWTPDGYIAVVTINNFQKHRGIKTPGWELSWTWAKHEVIWNMIGAQTTNQGGCSGFTGNIPYSCKKNPTIVDLKPGVPYNQQIANCCKGGVISSWSQDRADSESAFQLAVGRAGTTDRTVKMPMKFVFKVPGGGYTCGPARVVVPTRFITPDKRRTTRAMMTWKVTCLYSGPKKPSR